MGNKLKSSIDFTDHSCLECGQLCINRRSVGNHINRTHSMSIHDYVLKHYFKGVAPYCGCGCGQNVRWHSAQYYFCDYLSGHNGSGFSATNQPKWTPEKLQRRNDSIRKTYKDKDKGNEIKQKISISLKETFSDEETRNRMLKAQNAGRAKPGVLQKISAVRKRVWAEQHDELYKKIFTSEFRKKISEANMRRDLKHVSKEEIKFKEWLSTLINEDIDCHWINDDKLGTANFDAFIKSKNILIEWDGTYYHGLDRTSDFTIGQLIHMTNDFRKNIIALNAGMNLARISGNTNLSDIKCFDDLIAAARHYQTADGIVIRDGMFSFESDNQVIISRESLIRTNETSIFPDAKGRDYTKNEILPVLRAFLQCVVKHRGWFYPSSSEKISTVLNDIRKHVINYDSKCISSLTIAGNNFLKTMFRSFWDVDGGPVKAFDNVEKLDAVLKYRLGLNSSMMYTYELDDGKSVSCHETFDITPKEIRTGFVVQRNSVSWFKPTAAYEIYKRFLGDIKNPAVWDPSCGFGARLLGFAAAYPEGTYVGTDPAKQTFFDLATLSNELKTVCPSLNIDISCCGSETFEPKHTFDIVFTSPPYFDKEKYFDDDSQCWKKFPAHADWIKEYLTPTFSIAFKHMKNNGYLVINIDKENEAAIIDAATTVGFVKYDELMLNVGRDHFNKKRSKKTTSNKSEPIIVFKKM